MNEGTADGGEPPFLLIHGTGDDNVEVRESESFATALERAGVDTELLLLPNVSHTGAVSNRDTYRAVEDFLTRLSGLSDDSGGGESLIAFVSDRDGNEEVYVMDANGSNPRNLTNNPTEDWFPRWSPDGSQITFSSRRGGNLDIYVMNADGGNVRRLTDSPREDFNSVWQPWPTAAD